MVHNSRKLELRSVVLFKANVESKSDQYLLVIAQKHPLNEGQEGQTIGRINSGKTQMDFNQDLNMSLKISHEELRLVF